jgi:formimidoylglutamate deiminase
LSVLDADVERVLWAPRAWLPDGWADRVLLHVGRDGRWERIGSDVAEPPPGARVLEGPALPGLVDAHSHAFQRAFAGLAERRDADRAHDDFWSWRERMYAVAGRIDPEGLRAIAAHLYVELLRGGYTHVCEFHYLQHRDDGASYDDPLALSWALADAAADAGVGLTVLPVLYERAGFDGALLQPRQRRFALDADGAWATCRRIAAAGRSHVESGLAIHSLRAASPAAVAGLVRLAEGYDGAIHVHVAEQVREVEECLATHGERPVQWLAAHVPGGLDERWQLVHATHVEPAEIAAVAAARAGAVLCPGTEANLGDGITDLPGWLAAGDVRLSIGSDSHVTRAWREELRLAEYGQRLVRRERNVAAGRDGEAWIASTAERLWRRALEGSGAAAGHAHRGRWGLVEGARADLLVVDTRDASVLGVPGERLLDALVFSSPGRPWRDVLVAGRWVVREHRHLQAAGIAARFEAAMQRLWEQS